MQLGRRHPREFASNAARASLFKKEDSGRSNAGTWMVPSFSTRGGSAAVAIPGAITVSKNRTPTIAWSVLIISTLVGPPESCYEKVWRALVHPYIRD